MEIKPKTQNQVQDIRRSQAQSLQTGEMSGLFNKFFNEITPMHKNKDSTDEINKELRTFSGVKVKALDAEKESYRPKRATNYNDPPLGIKFDFFHHIHDLLDAYLNEIDDFIDAMNADLAKTDKTIMADLLRKGFSESEIETQLSNIDSSFQLDNSKVFSSSSDTPIEQADKMKKDFIESETTKITKLLCKSPD